MALIFGKYVVCTLSIFWPAMTHIHIDGQRSHIILRMIKVYWFVVCYIDSLFATDYNVNLFQYFW